MVLFFPFLYRSFNPCNGNVACCYCFLRNKNQKNNKNKIYKTHCVLLIGMTVIVFFYRPWWCRCYWCIWCCWYWCWYFCLAAIYIAYISIYIAVCFTIERFIAIRYPLKRQTFCTESLAKKVIAGKFTLKLKNNNDNNYVACKMFKLRPQPLFLFKKET